MVGSGSYENELQKYVEINELSENIRFKGLLARSEVVSLVKESHIVVSASIFETFGVNVIEGLSVGRPCVVLDSGGPRDIMRKEDGILFEKNTSEAFEEALEKVIIEDQANYKLIQSSPELLLQGALKTPTIN